MKRKQTRITEMIHFSPAFQEEDLYWGEAWARIAPIRWNIPGMRRFRWICYLGKKATDAYKISHEILHAILWHLEGEDTSWRLDNIRSSDLWL